MLFTFGIHLGWLDILKDELTLVLAKDLRFHFLARLMYRYNRIRIGAKRSDLIFGALLKIDFELFAI